MIDKYQIDFERLVTWMLPSFKRFPKRIAWLYRSMKVLRDMHASFISFGQERIAQAQVQSQVIILENYLIGRFGPGIVINPQEVGQLTYISDDDDSVQSYIGADDDASALFFIADDTDSSAAGTNVIVQVPAALSVDEAELRAVLNKYKVPGSDYTIEYI